MEVLLGWIGDAWLAMDSPVSAIPYKCKICIIASSAMVVLLIQQFDCRHHELVCQQRIIDPQRKLDIRRNRSIQEGRDSSI